MYSFKDLFLKITEDFKTVTQKFIDANIPTDDVTTYITKFRTLSNNQRLSGLEKNIDTWGNKSFDEFKKFIDDIESKVTKSGQKKDSGTSVDITTPKQKAAGWNIIIPTSKESSCYHGTGTDWCVSKRDQDYFQQYFLQNDITLVFCLNDKKEKWAIACNSKLQDKSEFFDAYDEPLSNTEFDRQTKLNSTEIIKLALGDKQVTVDRTTQQKLDLGYLLKQKLVAGDSKAEPKLEKMIVLSKNSKYAYLYAMVLKGPFKAGEEAISKDPEYAYYYAKNVLKGPFKAGEEAISKDGDYAYYYAMDILTGPFKAGEEVISKNSEYAYLYAKNVLKGPFEAGEEAISKDPDYAYYYAKNSVKGPFKAGEEAISKDPDHAYHYAKNILGDPDPKTWNLRYKSSNK